MLQIKTIGLRLFVVLIIALGLSGTASAAPREANVQPDFGPNVTIFDPTMPTAQIQAAVDAIANQQVDNEMGTQRYALLFKPGVYGTVAEPLGFQVGYYTEVAGLGISPLDVQIKGHIDVYNRCLTPTNCIALNNFWRSLSNLTIKVMGQTGCRDGINFWAVSQASPIRRVNITGGKLSLFDGCTALPQYSSGGFIADSRTADVINGTQQQFFHGNSRISSWAGAVWNQVYAGVENAPPQSFSTTPYNPPPVTTLATSPITREKPFLYIDASGNYNVFVPAVRTNSAGTSWGAGPTAGSSISINRFFIAKPTDSAATINNALASGLNLIFTPGIYQLDETIRIQRGNTVVLGLGLPTLVPRNGVVAMAVADVKSVKIAGLMFDAGTTNSPMLLKLGPANADKSNPSNPTTLSDVFFRIGGATPGKATNSLVVNSDNVILDNIWAWRADHGNGVGWKKNTAESGLIINGDNVIAYGLFVEHYQKYQVIWNGENGRTIMFQNEMPYDVPNQAAWQHDGINGYAAYKVADSVTTHEAWGLGSYCFFNVDPSIHARRGFEVPVNAGVKLHDILTVSLGGQGTIDHVVNDTGNAAQGASTIPVNIVSFP